MGRWQKFQADLLRRREGKAKSEPAYLATPGHFEAARPLDVMQIDHTPVGITAVGWQPSPCTRSSDA